MVTIKVGSRCIKVSRVPVIGEHIALPDEGEQLVTRVVHLPENGQGKGVRAVVALAMPRPAEPPVIPQQGDVHLIIRRRSRD